MKIWRENLGQAYLRRCDRTTVSVKINRDFVFFFSNFSPLSTISVIFCKDESCWLTSFRFRIVHYLNFWIWWYRTILFSKLFVRWDTVIFVIMIAYGNVFFCKVRSTWRYVMFGTSDEIRQDSLRCMIDSDLENLDRLNVQYPWLPNTDRSEQQMLF